MLNLIRTGTASICNIIHVTQFAVNAFCQTLSSAALLSTYYRLTECKFRKQ